MTQKILKTTIIVWEGAYSTQIDSLSLQSDTQGTTWDQISICILSGMALNISKDRQTD